MSLGRTERLSWLWTRCFGLTVGTVQWDYYMQCTEMERFWTFSAIKHDFILLHLFNTFASPLSPIEPRQWLGPLKYIWQKRNNAKTCLRAWNCKLSIQHLMSRLWKALPLSLALPFFSLSVFLSVFASARQPCIHSFSLALPPHQITPLLTSVMLTNKGLKAHSRCNCL